MIAISLAKLLFGKLLSSPDLKKRVFAALRAKAKLSSTTIDDEAVDIVEEVWDVIIPIIIGKL